MSVQSPRAPFGYDRTNSLLSNKRFSTLPLIEHPSKRINENQRDSLDIRGRSRDGLANGEIIRNEYSTPQSNRRKHRRSHSTTTNDKLSKSFDVLQDIPEYANTTSVDHRDKVRLPIFGRRAESSTSSYDNPKERESPRTLRILIDELESSLREKVRSQLHDVRTKFRHATQNNSNGKLTRQAFQHFIATIFGTQKQVSPNHIEKLLERLNLKHQNKISFDQFLEGLFNGEEQLPGWISHQPTPRSQSTSTKTANQLFNILKEKVRMRDQDLAKLIPAINGGPTSRIFKAQFYNALSQMGYSIKDTEFDKLWDRFDTDGFKAVNSDKFLKILTNESIGEETFVPIYEENDETILEQSTTNNQPKTPRVTTSRSQIDENQIQNWLNHKFPHGFGQLEKSLERLDFKQMGTLPRDRFLEELKRFGLKLEDHLLEYFLKRLNVDLSLTNDGIPYRDVLNAFKQKSDPTRKRINADNQLPPEENRQTALERQIDYCLSMNYERVREQLKRLDISRHGTVTANEIRSIIEDLINYTLKADEYYQFLKQIPMDENGRIKYKQFLNQVLDRTLIFQEQQQQKSSRNPQYEFTQPIHTKQKLNTQQLQQKRTQKHEDSNDNFQLNSIDQQKTRSIDELREMLKSLIRTRYKDIEDQFKRLDRRSYGELTPDLLFDLFKHLNVEVNRNEIDLIWSRCHLKRDGNLDFYQFLREFGYSKGSAHYPNAKYNPPKRGDADFILTSNRLYGDSVLVRGTVLNVIRAKWNELRREFTELDPYRTSFIQSDEFDDILTQLCSSVNQDDLDTLKYRFQSTNDSRINYVRFLKHYAPSPELIGAADEPNRNTLPTIHEKSPRPMLTQVSHKLTRKLSECYKALRRTFKQHDTTNTGSVPVKVFKQILIQYKCILNDEEFYTLTSQLDTRMDGTINYNYFLQQYIKNT